MSSRSSYYEVVAQEKIDVETLEGLEPLSALSPARLKDLANDTCIESIDAMKCLFVEGDKDENLIFLLNGEIELRSSLRPDVQIITAGMPETWNPIANKQPRQMTAITRTPIELIKVDIDKFDQMLTWDQMATVKTSTGDVDKIQVKGMGGDWRTKLKSNLTLNNLPPANIEKLFERMEPVEVSVGDVVIKQGDPGDYFYLIDSGIAKVTRQMMGAGKAVELAELGPGVSFGEEALISDKPRNANVIMVSGGLLYRLSRADFDELLKEPLLDSLELSAALQKLEEGALFLDVRVPSEYKQGHLPNSINIPLNELRQRLNQLEQDKFYICYCTTGRRSSAASFILNQQGIKSSTLLNGVQTVPNTYMIV